MYTAKMNKIFVGFVIFVRVTNFLFKFLHEENFCFSFKVLIGLYTTLFFLMCAGLIEASHATRLIRLYDMVYHIGLPVSRVRSFITRQQQHSLMPCVRVETLVSLLCAFLHE